MRAAAPHCRGTGSLQGRGSCRIAGIQKSLCRDLLQPQHICGGGHTSKAACTTPSECCLHCSPYIASASSSFSRSARACPDSADRLTLVLQHQHRKAWGQQHMQHGQACFFMLSVPSRGSCITQTRHTKAGSQETPQVPADSLAARPTCPVWAREPSPAPDELPGAAQQQRAPPAGPTARGLPLPAHWALQALTSNSAQQSPAPGQLLVILAATAPAHKSLHWCPDWGPAVCRQSMSELDASGSSIQKEAVLGGIA